MLLELDPNSADMDGLLPDISTSIKLTNAQKIKLKMAIKKLQKQRKENETQSHQPVSPQNVNVVNVSLTTKEVTALSRLKKHINKLNNIHNKYTKEMEKYAKNEYLTDISNGFKILRKNLANYEQETMNKLSKQSEVDVAGINEYLLLISANLDAAKKLTNECEKQVSSGTDLLDISTRQNKIVNNVTKFLKECTTTVDKDIQSLDFEYNPRNFVINTRGKDNKDNKDDNKENQETKEEKNDNNFNDCRKVGNFKRLDILCAFNEIKNINKHLQGAESNLTRNIGMRIDNFEAQIVSNTDISDIQCGISFEIENLVLDKEMTVSQVVKLGTVTYSADEGGSETRYYYNIILGCSVDYNDGNGFDKEKICRIKNDYLLCFNDPRVNSVIINERIFDAKGGNNNNNNNNNNNTFAKGSFFDRRMAAANTAKKLINNSLIDIGKEGLVNIGKIKRLINMKRLSIGSSIKLMVRIKTHKRREWSKPVIVAVKITMKKQERSIGGKLKGLGTQGKGKKKAKGRGRFDF